MSKHETSSAPPAHDHDFMFTPIPMTHRRETWKQVLVWIGFGYVATGLFIGGALAGANGGPLLADYYITRKCRYDITQINSQPKYNYAGVISALAGMASGLVMALNNILSDWPTGLLALVITVIIYLILHPLLAAKATSPATGRS